MLFALDGDWEFSNLGAHRPFVPPARFLGSGLKYDLRNKQVIFQFQLFI